MEGEIAFGMIGMFIGVVIMSALIIVLTILYTLKSTPKKGTMQKQPQPVRNKEANPTSGGESARLNGTVKGAENLPAWKKTRLILKAIRSFLKPNTPLGQPPIEEELAGDERYSMPLSDVTGPQPEIDTVPYSTKPTVSNIKLANGGESDVNTISALPIRAEQEASSAEPVNKENPDVNVTNALTASGKQEVSSMEPVNKENPDVNVTNALTASGKQEVSSMEPVNDERSRVNMESESELGEHNEADTNEVQKQEITTGDLSDLFAEEVAEEGNASKLAKSLSNVDILDLMREGQNFVNDIKGTKG